jgi:hypothetical protein
VPECGFERPLRGSEIRSADFDGRAITKRQV